MREGLIAIIKDSLFKHINKSCNLAENIADDLLENGVVALPCKIGQSFWRINWKYQIEPCRVSMLTQKSDCNFKIRISPLNGAAFEIVPSDIGKTVFLSRDDAERALRKEGGAEC